MPKAAAVFRTVFFVSTIYSPSLIARSRVFSFKMIPPFRVKLILILKMPLLWSIHYMNGKRIYSMKRTKPIFENRVFSRKILLVSGQCKRRGQFCVISYGIKKSRLVRYDERKAGSAHLCRAHLLSTIFNFTTSIRNSFLHFGQYSGNFTRTVSSYTFVLVLPPQVGQRIHKDSF